MTTAWSKGRLERMREVMASHVAGGEVPGLVWLVSRRGEVVVDVAGKMAIDREAAIARDAIFRIASMTKPITAAAAMILVEECKLRLDDPVDRWLPELANRKVLTRIDAPLSETVPAKRPIVVRDLLTFCMGFGQIWARPDQFPIQRAERELGLFTLGPPKPATAHAPDEWMKRLGTLPLMHQPGERWMYNTGASVLGVLIARASGKPLEAFLRERIFEPLGMKDTGFVVPAAKLGRFVPSYRRNPSTGALEVYDGVAESQWTRDPAFPDAAAGLVSTIGDYLAFGQMMLNHGVFGRERILSRPSVETMTTDQLTADQRAGAEPFLGGDRSWGFGVAIVVRRDDVSAVPGRFGWDGGFGTSWASDPKEGLIGILMTQRMWESPSPPAVHRDFWTCTYQAIED
jgi:CubicO group peptidase (beta-lactamase class C family)